jgi:hypothetical protein
MNNISRRTNNTSCPKFESFVLNNAATGDISNDRIKTCYICKNNGWPHEAITFEKILGRVLSDGSNEIRGWTIRDYFTGQIHRHRGNKLKRGGI